MSACIPRVLSDKLLAPLSRLQGAVRWAAVLTVLSLLSTIALAQSTGINGGGPNGGGGGGGSGTVTSVGTGTGLTGGPITSSGTISLISPITTPVALSALANQGTTTTVLHGNAAGNPSFSAVNLATDVTGTLPQANLLTCAANQIVYDNASAQLTCSTHLMWTDSTGTLSLGTPGGSVTVVLPAPASGNAGTLTVRGANGVTSGNGSAVNLTAGNGVGTGRGGALNLSSGNGPGGGATVAITGGNATSGTTATGGDVSVSGGQGGGTGQAGAFIISGGSGDPASTGGGGTVNVSGGPGGGLGGLGGTIILTGGPASGAQAAGDILLAGGSAGTGRAGEVMIQDQSGNNAVLVDEFAHLSYASTTPSITACGTSPSLDAHASDTSGTGTVGSGVVASCTVTFGNPYTTWVHCRVTPQVTTAAFGYTYTTAHLVVTATSLTSGKFDYNCDGL